MEQKNGVKKTQQNQMTAEEDTKKHDRWWRMEFGKYWKNRLEN